MNSNYIDIARSRRNAALNSILSTTIANTQRTEQTMPSRSARNSTRTTFRSSRVNQVIFI